MSEDTPDWNMNEDTERQQWEHEMENRIEMSPEINEVAAALSKAQAKIQGAMKDADNPYFKSKYADLGNVWEACRKALTDNGLSVIQTTQGNDPDTVTMVTMLAHSSGQWIRGYLTMKPTKADPQGIGSCCTYARRYGLQAMVGVAPEDDDGNAASGNKSNGEGDKLAEHNKAVRENLDSVNAIKEHIATGDLYRAAENWFEMDDDTKKALWVAPTKGGIFTTDERETIKSDGFRTTYYGENNG